MLCAAERWISISIPGETNLSYDAFNDTSRGSYLSELFGSKHDKLKSAKQKLLPLHHLLRVEAFRFETTFHHFFTITISLPFIIMPCLLSQSVDRQNSISSSSKVYYFIIHASMHPATYKLDRALVHPNHTHGRPEETGTKLTTGNSCQCATWNVNFAAKLVKVALSREWLTGHHQQHQPTVSHTHTRILGSWKGWWDFWRKLPSIEHTLSSIRDAFQSVDPSCSEFHTGTEASTQRNIKVWFRGHVDYHKLRCTIVRGCTLLLWEQNREEFFNSLFFPKSIYIHVLT